MKLTIRVLRLVKAIEKSILWKFMTPALLIIALVMLVAGWLLSDYIENSLKRQAEDQIDAELRLSESILNTSNMLLDEQIHSGLHVLQSEAQRIGPPSLGPTVQVGSELVPNLLLGGKPQANNFVLVDKVKSLMGGSATLFVRRGMDFIRLSTNVQKNDGSRAIGTKLDPTGKAIAAINEGREYFGIADILGQASITGYSPMRDAQGRTIGVWFTGFPISTLKSLEETVAKAHVLESGFVAVLDDKGKIRFKSDRVSDETAAAIIGKTDPALSSQWVVTSRPFSPWGYTVVAAHRPGEIAAHVRQSEFVVLAIALFAGSLLGGVIFFITKRLIAIPMNRAATMMREIGKGHLKLRLSTGTSDEIGVLSNAMDAFAEDLQQGVVKTLRDVAAGDLSGSIAVQDHDDEIRPALNSVVRSLNGLVSEASALSRNAVSGNLAARGNPDNFKGGYREIISGFNETLDAVIGPLNTAATYVERISKGEIPPKIKDDFKGDFNTIKSNLNQCIEGLGGLVESNAVLQKVAMNDLTGKVEGEYVGIFAEVAGATNLVRERLLRMVEIANNTAAGNYADELRKLKSIGRHSANDALVPAFIRMMEAIDRLVTDTQILSRAGTEGRLQTRADVSRHEGEYRKVVQGVNDTLDAVIGPLNMAAKYVESISRGEIPPAITEQFNGDFNTIKANLNTCIIAITRLVEDSRLLSRAAVEGRVATRADATRHLGEFQAIVVGVNETLDTLLRPIEEGSRVLAEMAGGDLTARVSGEYSGDHQKLKASINTVAESLQRALADVSGAVGATSSAATQISSSTEELAAGAMEQTSQTQEVVNAVEEMSKTILENSKNAREAAVTAKRSRESVEHGEKVVEETITRMKRIGQVVAHSAQTVKELGVSSNQIGEIVSVIDDIADQTNLLALNAAIEAARAGDQGRGFAVVADEVRKLSERTTKATKEIATMIKRIQTDTAGAVASMMEGTKEVETGIMLADKSGESLREIVDVIERVTDMVTQIAAASEQQSKGSEIISQNVEAISSVTAQAATGTQQIARAAEDLNRLTENLETLVSKFTIAEGPARSSPHALPSPEKGRPAVRANGSLPPMSVERER